MFERKCPDCAKKVEGKFRFCPYCGSSFKQRSEAENYGMLGRDDVVEKEPEKQMKLPFGLNKIMGGLMEQLNKELGGMMNEGGGVPKGFKIQISTGKPMVQQVAPRVNVKQHVIHLSKEEAERRGKLPRKEAKSTIRRIGDVLVYEILTPGVNNKEQVIITKLEEGIEVKAYSKDKCYYKTILLTVEVLRWGVLENKVVVELKG